MEESGASMPAARCLAWSCMLLQEFTQWPTYPQLLVNGELLGGCDIIMEMQQDGSLKTAVQEALGAQLNSKKALEQRLQQLLDSSPVMLFMKVRQEHPV